MTDTWEDAHHPLTPYLGIKDCKGALEWYEKELGFKVKKSMPMKDDPNKWMHCEFIVPNGGLMMASDVLCLCVSLFQFPSAYNHKIKRI